jgi:methionyl-tRNA synthetase
LLDLLAIPTGERNFSELAAGRRIKHGVTFPAPSPVFPRYLEAEPKA